MTLAATLGLLATSDLLSHPLAFLTLHAVGMGALWFAVRRLTTRPVSARWLLAVAAVLRLLLLPLPPSLSEDALRYLWDGRVAAAGMNPYAQAPSADLLTPLRDPGFTRLPHRDVPTVYPPLALAFFSIASQAPRSLLVWKAMLALVDLWGCWLLMEVLARRGLAIAAAVLYAWNPLVVLETAGMGHVDALGATAAIAAVALLTRGAASRSASAAAAGVLAKLLPLAALPMWARQSGRPWRFWVVAGGLVAIAVAPVLVATGGLPPGLVAYGVSWEFNGPLYEPLWRLVAASGVETLVTTTLDSAKEWTGAHEFWNRFYPWVYPRFLAKLALGLASLGAIAWSVRERDSVAGTGRLFGRLLLLSATFYPWYLLWVLPWAAARRQWSWLVLAAVVPLAYLPKAMAVNLWPWLFLAIWAPFWVAWVAHLRLRPRVP